METYEEARDSLHSEGSLTEFIDHSLTRINKYLKLCGRENVV